MSTFPIVINVALCAPDCSRPMSTPAQHHAQYPDFRLDKVTPLIHRIYRIFRLTDSREDVLWCSVLGWNLLVWTRSVICGEAGNDFWHLTRFSFPRVHKTPSHQFSGGSQCPELRSPSPCNLDFSELHSGARPASRYDSCTGIWNILQNYSQNWRNVSFSILVTIRNQTQDQGHRPPLRSQPLFSLQTQNTLSYFVSSTASKAILFLAHFVHFHVTTTYWYLQI